MEFGTQEISLDLPTTDATPKRYKAVIPLFAPIDVEKSNFKIMGTKLEVTFVKGDGSSWPVLRSDDVRTGEVRIVPFIEQLLFCGKSLGKRILTSVVDYSSWEGRKGSLDDDHKDMSNEKWEYNYEEKMNRDY